MPNSRAHLWLPLIYFVAGISWVLGSDFVLSQVAVEPGISDVVGSLKGVIFVGLSALLIYIVMSRQPVPAETRPLPPMQHGGLLRPVLIFLLAGLGIAGSGWVIYRQQSEVIRFEAGDDLSMIGELKAQQIEQWLADREMSVERAGRNAALAHLILDAGDPAAGFDAHAQLRNALLQSIR